MGEPGGSIFLDRLVVFITLISSHLELPDDINDSNENENENEEDDDDDDLLS